MGCTPAEKGPSQLGIESVGEIAFAETERAHRALRLGPKVIIGRRREGRVGAELQGVILVDGGEKGHALPVQIKLAVEAQAFVRIIQHQKGIEQIEIGLARAFGGQDGLGPGARRSPHPLHERAIAIMPMTAAARRVAVRRIVAQLRLRVADLIQVDAVQPVVEDPGHQVADGSLPQGGGWTHGRHLGLGGVEDAVQLTIDVPIGAPAGGRFGALCRPTDRAGAPQAAVDVDDGAQAVGVQAVHRLVEGRRALPGGR